MHCPHCVNTQLEIQMTESLVNEVPVDACEECGGIWLDPGELERLTDTTWFSEEEPAPMSVIKLSWVAGTTDRVRLEHPEAQQIRVIPLREVHRLAGRETTDPLYLSGRALWRCHESVWKQLSEDTG